MDRRSQAKESFLMKNPTLPHLLCARPPCSEKIEINPVSYAVCGGVSASTGARGDKVRRGLHTPNEQCVSSTKQAHSHSRRVCRTVAAVSWPRGATDRAVQLESSVCRRAGVADSVRVAGKVSLIGVRVRAWLGSSVHPCGGGLTPCLHAAVMITVEVHA